MDASIEFSFLDDTGASIMVMYEDDIESLENKANELPKVMGAARLNGAFGGWWVLVYKLEVNMKDHNGNNLVEWTDTYPGGCAPMGSRSWNSSTKWSVDETSILRGKLAQQWPALCCKE